jgi:DNA-binding transcriptional LysR family regulator
MNFNNIKYFLAIVEEGNVSKAAERLHVSQQSLSEQLQKIEDEVGVTLIKRSRPISLTPAGKIFSNTAAGLLVTYNGMLDEIASIAEKDRSRITLAVPSTETPPFLPGLLTAFSSEYPDFEIKIMRVNPIDAAKNSRDFDLFFSVLPLAPELDHIPLSEGDTYAVAFSAGLAERIYGGRWPDLEAQLLEKRDIGVLREMPFILLRNKLEDVVLDRQIIFRDAGFEPRVAFMSENDELNANMCVLGSGVYVASMHYCRLRFKGNVGHPDGVLLYPIDTRFDPVAITLSYRKGKRLSKADSSFVRIAKRYLAKH